MSFNMHPIRGGSGADVVVEALGAAREATAAPGSYDEGAAVEVMIRPEDICLGSLDAGPLATIVSAS